MKCPICGSEMQEGGLVAGFRGVPVSWQSGESFEKIRWHMSSVGNGKTIKTQFKLFSSVLKIPNAFYCERCNKVVGVFDIKENEE